MTLSIYDASIPVFRETLTKQLRMIDRSEAILRERGLSEAAAVEARLYPDMYPLTEQARAVPQLAMVVTSRLTGIAAPIADLKADSEASFEAFRRWSQAGLNWIDGITPDHLAGVADKEIIFPLRHVDCSFTGRSFLFSFGLPNLFFHASMFYAILRNIGVPLGKSDFVLPQFTGQAIVVG